MKITIDIPREYERDFIGDKFKDFFSRVIADINCDGMCGFYEKEIAEMFLEAFDNAIVGEINPNAKVIPVANISFDKDDMQKMIQDELKKFQIENNTDDLQETIRQVKKAGVRLFAAHLKGERSYDQEDYTGNTGFLIGNEANGLSAETADMADCYIKIPMLGKVESLNAAVAASILMYETARQRRND